LDPTSVGATNPRGCSLALFAHTKRCYRESTPARPHFEAKAFTGFGIDMKPPRNFIRFLLNPSLGLTANGDNPIWVIASVLVKFGRGRLRMPSQTILSTSGLGDFQRT
jgi:hypothetical protein